MAKPVDPDVRASIVATIELGQQSCRQIARDYGISPSTVSSIAKAEGLSFERAQQTAAAAAAVKVDARMLRLAAMSRLYSDEERLAARMWAPYRQYVPDQRGGDWVEYDIPPVKEQQQIIAARNIALERAAKLEHHDADDGLAAGKTMLNDLFGALRLAYHEIVAEDAEVDLTAPMEEFESQSGAA